MNVTTDFSGKVALVTGATGCIGGRLVERLAQIEGLRVKALVRNYGRAVRIARLPIELVTADLLDPASLAGVVAGCDIVFHCAYGSDGDREQQWRTTVDGTRNLARVAAEAKVQRFVHVSTVSVHGFNPGPEIDENAPFAHHKDDWYATTKIEAEKHVQAAQSMGLPAVIVRPAVVYGPYSVPWTIGPVESLLGGTFNWVDQGRGTCCPIYVDDVAEALARAAVAPEALGAILFLAGQPASWREFFQYYLDMTGVQHAPSWTRETWRVERQRAQFRASSPGKTLALLGRPRVRDALRETFIVGHGMRALGAILPERTRRQVLAGPERIEAARQQGSVLPSELAMHLFCSKTVYRTDRIERILGFHPRYDLRAGMRLTQDWLEYSGMLSTPRATL